MKNIHSDLDKYTDQWEKALKDGFLDSSPHLPEPQTPSLDGQPDFFGQWSSGDEPVQMNESEANYWNNICRLAAPASHPIKKKIEIVSEASVHDPDTKYWNEMKKSNPNPIQSSSVGKDQDVVVTPNWTDGKELKELADLKVRLEKLESKLNSQEGMGDSGKSAQSQIDSLKKQIDELSDSLFEDDSERKD